MELMEDGNLVDKVNILIQKDMEYYKNKQSILQESICLGVVGGKLDFPRSASFAAIKLVLWWEEEFLAAYRTCSGFTEAKSTASEDNLETTGGCGGIVKTSDPTKFMMSVSKSSEQLLDHLHVLTLEALDHADLTVLNGTIGAAALLKNCLWFFIQTIDMLKVGKSFPLQASFKKYREMCEALAERLLDLHCRLLSLYIIQDAESLDWENNKAFFENERGSYVIQMWWIYMNGSRHDLWTTVPPKMARRVFSGMLNEILTILTVRYIQARPSECRTKLFAVDISNLLFCVGQLLPSVCNDGEELLGFNINSQSKAVRDIHAKCQELFTCLVLRCSPLDIIYKVFRKGLDCLNIMKSRGNNINSWIVFALPHVFTDIKKDFRSFEDLSNDTAIYIELSVLLTQSEPNWSSLLKVMCMREAKVLTLILRESIKGFMTSNEFEHTVVSSAKCGGFLCLGNGVCTNDWEKSLQLTPQHYYKLIMAVSHIFLSIGNDWDLINLFLPELDSHEWAQCFDRKQMWNQKRPPWYEAILQLLEPILPMVSKTVISAVQTGASMYQAMSIVLACFSQLWQCVDSCVSRIAYLIQDLLPVNVHPIGNSCLLQLLLSSLYSELLRISEFQKKEVKFSDGAHTNDTVTKDPLVHKNSICSFDGTTSSEEAIALAIAEALCSIDEDNKHTEQIDEFIEQAKYYSDIEDIQLGGCKRVENSQQIEMLTSDVLMSKFGKRSLKMIYFFINTNSKWLQHKLGIGTGSSDCLTSSNKQTSLLQIMFHIGDNAFDQLLTGQLKPDWFTLLQKPLGLSSERIWQQISSRWEFAETSFHNLSPHTSRMVNTITTLFKSK